MKKWIQFIAFDAFFAGLFYLWKFEGVEGAGNIVMLSFWVFIVLGFVVGFSMDESHFKDKDAGRRIYHNLTNIGWFFAFAYFGHLFTALMWAIGALCVQAAKNKPKKETGDE